MIYGLVLVLAVSPVSASIGDNLSGSLLEAVESVKKDTDKIDSLEEKIDNLEKSTTSIQYNVSAANGNKVTITAPSYVAYSTMVNTTKLSVYEGMKEQLDDSFYENEYYKIESGDLDWDEYQDIVFTDKKSGLQYSVIKYDESKDELTLFLRHIVGEWGRAHTGTTWRGTPPGYYVKQYSDFDSGPWFDVGVPADSIFTSFLKNNSLPDLGILNNNYTVGSTDTSPRSVENRVIPSEFRSFVNSSGKTKTWNDYWAGCPTNKYYADTLYYDIYSVFRDVFDMAGYSSILLGYRECAFYANIEHVDSDVDVPTHGVAVNVTLKGDLGEYNKLKTLVQLWNRLNSAQVPGSGFTVKVPKLLPSASPSLSGTGYEYPLVISDAENNLSSPCANALLTGSAGGSFSIPYTSTMSTKKTANTDKLGESFSKFVDVVIRDSSNNVLYFGRCSPARLGDGTIKFTIPEDLEEDTVYLMQVFEETCYTEGFSKQGISSPIVSTISTPVNMQLVIGE